MTAIEFFGIETIIGIASVSLWIGLWMGLGVGVGVYAVWRLTHVTKRAMKGLKA